MKTNVLKTGLIGLVMGLNVSCSSGEQEILYSFQFKGEPAYVKRQAYHYIWDHHWVEYGDSQLKGTFVSDDNKLVKVGVGRFQVYDNKTSNGEE